MGSSPLWPLRCSGLAPAPRAAIASQVRALQARGRKPNRREHCELARLLAPVVELSRSATSRFGALRCLLRRFAMARWDHAGLPAVRSAAAAALILSELSEEPVVSRRSSFQPSEIVLCRDLGAIDAESNFMYLNHGRPSQPRTIVGSSTRATLPGCASSTNSSGWARLPLRLLRSQLHPNREWRDQFVLRSLPTRQAPCKTLRTSCASPTGHAVMWR
jgi:hypothetical protein